MDAHSQLKKFVWDTSAILNIKELNAQGYSPAHSLMRDLSDSWIPGAYQNIFPSIAAFEVDASVSRMLREGKNILREFYIVDDCSVIYPIDQDFIRRSSDLVTMDGFLKLRGADLIFACVAYIECACLVTLDGHFNFVSEHVQVLDLNESRDAPHYRRVFDSKGAMSLRIAPDEFLKLAK